jgi:hypothetical protein
MTWFWFGHSTFFSSAHDSKMKWRFGATSPAGRDSGRASSGNGRRPASATRAMTYLVSRCGVCVPHHRQYFLNSTRSGVLRFDFDVW